MADEWVRLSLFESRDLVARLHKQRHNLEISDGKARSIAAHMIQGREYFASARGAGSLVRPLLLYYGILAFSRGLVLFLDTKKSSEATLAAKHGLHVLRWEQGLAGGIQNFPSLQIEFQAGTFSELTSATRNVDVAMIEDIDYRSRPRKREGTMALVAGTTVTIKDILARIPQLQDLYARSFGEQSQCYAGHVLEYAERASTDVAIYQSDKGLPDEVQVRAAFNIPASQPVSYSTMHSIFGDDLPHLLYRIGPSSGTTLRLPSTFTLRRDCQLLVAPFANGLELSQLSVLYLIAYAMGMLVRYYPSIWLSFTGRNPGDLTFPLLNSAMSVIQQRFPELVADTLEE